MRNLAFTFFFPSSFVVILSYVLRTANMAYSGRGACFASLPAPMRPFGGTKESKPFIYDGTKIFLWEYWERST